MDRSEYNLDEKYLTYPFKVISGEVVTSKYVKLACKRYLDWLKRDDIEFMPKKVDKVVNFISKLKHFTGKSSGNNFKLEPWQFFIVCNIFGFYWKDKRTRVIRNAYIEVGRKAGKSALVSAIALYCLIADKEDGAECDVIANSRQQARILFDMCSNFCRGLDPKAKLLRPFRDKIKFDATKSFAQVLAADASKLDGFNASFFVQDELHEAPNSKLYDVLKSSQGMRSQPLALCITSAGFNRFGFCYQMRTVCTEILEGLKTDDSQFSIIYCLDEGDDWKDEEVWVKANPNLDITVTRDYLREQVKQATNNSSLEVGVKTKNFGIWCTSSDVWLSEDLLLQSTAKVNLDDFSDAVGFMGVDLASVSDLTALAVMIPKEDKFYFKAYYYLPESALVDNSNSELYKKWKREGLLTITTGNVTDYDYVISDMKKINEKIIIDKVAYDSYNATSWAIDCTSEGFPLVPYSQALWNFNKPTKEFERLIKSGRVVIDDNEINRYCFRNVTLKQDYNQNVKPVKQYVQSQEKIDGCIAMLESLGIYLGEERYDNEILTV